MSTSSSSLPTIVATTTTTTVAPTTTTTVVTTTCADTLVTLNGNNPTPTFSNGLLTCPATTGRELFMFLNLGTVNGPDAAANAAATTTLTCVNSAWVFTAADGTTTTITETMCYSCIPYTLSGTQVPVRMDCAATAASEKYMFFNMAVAGPSDTTGGALNAPLTCTADSWTFTDAGGVATQVTEVGCYNCNQLTIVGGVATRSPVTLTTNQPTQTIDCPLGPGGLAAMDFDGIAVPNTAIIMCMNGQWTYTEAGITINVNTVDCLSA
uniref:C6 domain-containing protein n=1 Tax=Panagrolaimus sp. PS1159 TaxID=55785 RepID=A0AC35GTI4_9BILA